MPSRAHCSASTSLLGCSNPCHLTFFTAFWWLPAAAEARAADEAKSLAASQSKRKHAASAGAATATLDQPLIG